MRDSCRFRTQQNTTLYQGFPAFSHDSVQFFAAATQQHKEVRGNARKHNVLQGFGGPGNLQIFLDNSIPRFTKDLTRFPGSRSVICGDPQEVQGNIRNCKVLQGFGGPGISQILGPLHTAFYQGIQRVLVDLLFCQAGNRCFTKILSKGSSIIMVLGQVCFSPFTCVQRVPAAHCSVPLCVVTELASY